MRFTFSSFIFWILIGCCTVFSASCLSGEKYEKEPWISKPVSQWPNFALTNEVSFEDTTFLDLANGFLVNTGYDTMAVSCKHLFMVFEKYQNLNSIDLGEHFNYWKMSPKNHPDKIVQLKQLLNQNKAEPVENFNSLKVRDWLIFNIINNEHKLYPLRIRYSPVKTKEVVYCVGWGMKQKDNSKPALIKMRCVKDVGDYFFTKTLSEKHKPHGRSGSAVIDKNGYLVGIVSGAEGNLGVMGSTSYLKNFFRSKDIPFLEKY